MKDVIYYNDLYEIYGFLLTIKQKEIFELYYNENLSLSEIAEYKKVSKSYIGKVLDDIRKKLSYYEENIGHYKLINNIKN